MKMKSKKSILGNFIKRYFCLNLYKYTFAYKQKQEAPDYKEIIDINTITLINDKTPYEGPVGWQFGFIVQTKKKMLMLFANTEQIYRCWVEAFIAVNAIKTKPLSVLYAK